MAVRLLSGNTALGCREEVCASTQVKLVKSAKSIRVCEILSGSANEDVWKGLQE